MDRPDEMTPEQRLREVAAILATGYLRLRATESDKPLDCPAPPKRPLGLTVTETEVGQ